MQRNPYWPLKGPSFFESLIFRGCVFLSLHERARRLRVKFCGADGKADDRTFSKDGSQTGCLVFGTHFKSQMIPCAELGGRSEVCLFY